MNRKKLNCILLIDDDEDINFYHKRLIEGLNCAKMVHVAKDGLEAIDFLKKTMNGYPPRPELIFLDINMPRMNGWDFLEVYERLEDQFKGSIVVVLLTTSLNPEDRIRGESNANVNAFMNKYIQKEDLVDIIQKNYPEVQFG